MPGSTNVWPFLVGLAWLLTNTAPGATEGLVLCAPGDPYQPLAREISSETGYGLVDNPKGALAANPIYLVWVAAPTDFSDPDLVGYATQVRDRASSVSLGFITGKTIEQARAFWRRGRGVQGQRFAIANGADPHAGRFSNRLVRIAGEERIVEPLTLAGLQDALVTADYVSHTGHGTPTRLRLDDRTALSGEEMPALSGLVLTSGSCNSFRFWQKGSFLLALIERGAAAYAGFAYSPNSGYLLGALDELPLRHTWSEFPVGHAIQVLNHGCRQGFASFPFLLLAGDPRISLRGDRPYLIAEDRADGQGRMLRFSGAPRGVLPVRIPGGAEYRFVRIPGTAAATRDDWFYSARLQMADIAGDKYLLVLQSGGEVTIELRRQPPSWWPAMSCLAALDSTLILAMRHSFDLFQAALGGMTWLAIAWSMRQRRTLGTVWTPLLLGFVMAAGHGLYMALRLKHVVITSKPLDFSWLALVGTFLVTSGAAWLFYNGRRAAARWLGLLLPGLLFLLAAVVLAAVMGVLGWLISQRIGAPTLNLHVAWPYFITLLIILPGWIALVTVLKPRPTVGMSSDQALSAN